MEADNSGIRVGPGTRHFLGRIEDSSRKPPFYLAVKLKILGTIGLQNGANDPILDVACIDLAWNAVTTDFLNIRSGLWI